jgi:tetratricopeptide (TPR) repeat protein
MAIEQHSRTRKFKHGRIHSRASSKMNAIRVLVVILVIVPVVFYFTNPSARMSFINYQLGQANEKLNRLPQAAKNYDSSYKASNKTNKKAQLKYAEMLNRTKKWDQAVLIATELANQNLLDEFFLSDVELELARSNEGLGYEDDALIHYDKSAKLNGRNYNALIGLGRMKRVKGDNVGSRQYLEDAVNINNLRAPEAHYEMGLTYLAEGNSQDALEEFELTLSQLPNKELKAKASEKKLEIMGRS